MRSDLVRSNSCGGPGRLFGLLTAGLALGVIWSAAPLAAQGPPIRIAVVNLEYVAAESPAGKDLQEKLGKFQNEVRTEVETMTAVARSVRQKMTDGANTLSEDRLAELQKELEDAQIAIRRFQDDKQREGQKMQEEGLREIERQLEPVFAKIRDEGGYDLILNNVPGVVVMAGPRVDITGLVIEQLKAATDG